MIRHFCDLCRAEITEANDLSVFSPITMYLAGTQHEMTVSVSVEKSGPYGRDSTTLNDICRHCVIDEVKKLDKRPRDIEAIKAPKADSENQ